MSYQGLRLCTASIITSSFLHFMGMTLRAGKHVGLCDDREIVIHFSECLEDTALSFFNRLTPMEQDSWRLAKERFDACFGYGWLDPRGKTNMLPYASKKVNPLQLTSSS